MTLKSTKMQLLSLLPDPLVLTRVAVQDETRYLTFDDGPDPEHTPRLLDLLAKHGIQASFFVIGDKVKNYPELVARIVADGHMLGNHSYSHWSFKNMTLEQMLSEIERTDQLLSAFDHLPRHRMRTPRGDLPASLLLHFVRHRRSFIFWSYDSLDYQNQTDEALAARLRAHPPQAGDIVLMHDDSSKATTALEVLLPEWLASGYHFSALPAEA
jgi:peptidoglycan/xylan/chitin deacetylase (PgdA/CDA1 family)